MEDYSSSKDWEEFQQKLLNAKASFKGKEGKGPRYAIYDFQYELPGGEGTRYAFQGGLFVWREQVDGKSRNKIVFISWSPDEGTLVMVRYLLCSGQVASSDTDSPISAENDLCIVEGGSEECSSWRGERNTSQRRRFDRVRDDSERDKQRCSLGLQQAGLEGFFEDGQWACYAMAEGRKHHIKSLLTG